MKTQNRNALCLCGSGRKYKHCHGSRHTQPYRKIDGQDYVAAFLVAEHLRAFGAWCVKNNTTDPTVDHIKTWHAEYVKSKRPAPQTRGAKP